MGISKFLQRPWKLVISLPSLLKRSNDMMDVGANIIIMGIAKK